MGGADATWVRGVELRCDPASGYHPRAEQACAALAAAHGDIASIATPDDAYAGARRCGRAPDPVTATASGSYRGRPVQWRASYPSPCFLHADTGSLFRF
ncbi:protease inhibitor SIL-V5 [Streptomyces sp. JJ66]|nr:protease inhibitor SIL-V5 [Streptomyces sp. JJ66]